MMIQYKGKIMFSWKIPLRFMAVRYYVLLKEDFKQIKCEYIEFFATEYYIIYPLKETLRFLTASLLPAVSF